MEKGEINFWMVMFAIVIILAAVYFMFFNMGMTDVGSNINTEEEAGNIKEDIQGTTSDISDDLSDIEGTLS